MPYKDPEKRKQRDREYYTKNRDKILEKQQQYQRERDSEKKKEYQREWYKKNKNRLKQAQKESREKHGLKWKCSNYNIPIEEVEQAIEYQNKRCAICKKKKPLVIDHCHNTKQFRGLLCRECNLLLGFAYDKKEILCNAITYLEENNVTTRKKR